MKKIYFIGTLLVTFLSFGQAFTATYDFSGIPASATNGTTDPTAPPVVSGLSFGSFTAVVPSTPTTFTGSGGTGRFSYPNQPLGATNGDNVYANLTGAIDLTNYMEVTVTPNVGTSYNLSGITFRHQRSGTGVRTYAVRSSVDGYATNLPASISPANTELSVQAGNVFFRVLDAITTGQNGSTITLSGPSFTGLTTAVTFRVYGWNAEASAGTESIDDFAISGSITVLSVNENNISGLKIYPNPAKTNLFITSDNFETKQVEIYNVLGKVVLSAKATNAPVNISALSNGIYVVKVTENGKSSTRKLIIE